MVHGRPGHGISHFGELCSSRSPKSDESAPVLKICSFQKKAPYERGGCPDTLDPLDPPLLNNRRFALRAMLRVKNQHWIKCRLLIYYTEKHVMHVRSPLKTN